MASSLPSKITIQVDSAKEQQENIKTALKSSRTFAVLQNTGTVDKENKVGRQPAYIAKELLTRKTPEMWVRKWNCFVSVQHVLHYFSDTSQTPERKRKIQTNTASSSSQTSPEVAKSTVDDLTSEIVSARYWEVLGEKRRVALDEALTENQELYEKIATLEDELNESKSVIEQSRSIIEVMTEMLKEREGDLDMSLTSEPDQGQNSTNSQDDDDDSDD